MNFKKKDNKRSSYYVWFLGAKESKGLRGDEYVTPVLGYLLEHASDFEPSKVTLQVSHKGFKIIQMLTVPRKSAKLTADQTSQLFANCRRLSATGESSSLLKTEQVKHHIAHDSITWVYQEEDIICAILLLYNPITRCPVHVHAYRCDSIETADNLRRQLRALVDRPENQKKFRDIEARLAAKGLLLPPSYAGEEDKRAVFPSRHAASKYERSQTNKACNNSDGRSTRTEGSDEHSEESNSSNELGYGPPSRGRGPKSLEPRDLRQQARRQQREPSPPPSGLRYSSDVRPLSPPLSSLPAMHHPHLQHPPLPPPHPHQALRSKNSYPSPSESDFARLKSKNKVADTEPELPVGVSAALYDSLAAELRAKLGNPKAGPLLLPPKDYDSKEEKRNKAAAEKNKNKMAAGSPLSRSESSGKSSSGIGSDEALSSEQKKSTTSSANSSCYNSSSSGGANRCFDSDIPLARGKTAGVPDSRFLFGASDNMPRSGKAENERQLYSLQIYSSDEEDDSKRMLDYSPDDILDVDVEDFEENVNFTLATPYHLVKSKSTVDLHPSRAPHKLTSQPSHPQVVPALTRPAKPARNPHPAPAQPYLDRKWKHTNMDQAQLAKLYGSNPVLSHRRPAPLSPYKPSNETSKEQVVGRREQRTKQHQQPPSMEYHQRYPPPPEYPESKYNRREPKTREASSKPQRFYFADGELDARSRALARSNGNLAAEPYGPSSINVLVSADRSVSPYYYSHQAEAQHYPPGPSPARSKQFDARHDQQQQQRRGQLEQPYSRYSYIDLEHPSYFPR